MANTGVTSVIKALKKEVERQETMKMIEDKKLDPEQDHLASHSNATLISTYNKEVYNELLRAIVILEQSMSEKTQPVIVKPASKNNIEQTTITKILEDEFKIQEVLESAHEKGLSTGTNLQVRHEYNAMYKKEIGMALDYVTKLF